MRKSFKVILDCDDTLYKCNSEAIKKLNAEIGTNYTMYDIKNWGLTGTDIDKRLNYYSDPEFIKNLPLMEGAKEFVKELSKKAEIFIATHVQPQCAGVRFNSIVENFPEINPGNILIGGRKDMLVADMMLDDAVHNLQDAMVDYPVLYQQPWNYTHPGMLSVNGYKEFLELVDIIKANRDTDSNYQIVSLVGPAGSGKKEIAEKLVETGKFERVRTYSTKKNDDKYNYLSFPEFTERKDAGFFMETSIYMGDFYGTKKSDIDHIISKGKIPLMILDINGAVSLRRTYGCLNVFVKMPKEKCIKDVLNRNLELDEMVQRIMALDSELRNEELCDMTISDANDIDKIIERMDKHGEVL